MEAPPVGEILEQAPGPAPEVEPLDLPLGDVPRDESPRHAPEVVELEDPVGRPVVPVLGLVVDVGIGTLAPVVGLVVDAVSREGLREHEVAGRAVPEVEVPPEEPAALRAPEGHAP